MAGNKKPRRQCLFNSNLQKHISAVKAAASSGKIVQQFTRVTLGDTEKEVAAIEGTFAYHTIRHNQSFHSMECTSKIIKKSLCKKFSCAATKTTAIITNVFYPHVAKTLREDLAKSKFVTLYFDGSNHGNIKMFPILVRYFIPCKGLQTSLLKFTDLPGETAQLVKDYVLQTAKQNGLEGKIISVCADNTNTNFGGSRRGGQNNVFALLNSSLSRKIVGAGCVAHVLHNAAKTACEVLPIDVEIMIFKIYSWFRDYTVRTTDLREFCEFLETEYRQLLGYSSTRWLALAPAVERLLIMFEPLKSYFRSKPKEKCRKPYWNFLMTTKLKCGCFSSITWPACSMNPCKKYKAKRFQ